jgi:Zn-finger nucleic acid-binding protein
MRIVPERGYWFCEYCSSFTFPAESADGVQVLGGSGGRDCPVCGDSLVFARIAGAEVLHCSRCRGLLIEQRVFAGLVGYLRALAAGPPDAIKPLNPEERTREVHCPSCGKLMDTHPYYGPGNAVIDVCTACRAVWLDYGELGEIVDAPGRDRGGYGGRPW